MTPDENKTLRDINGNLGCLSMILAWCALALIAIAVCVFEIARILYRVYEK